MPNVVTRFITWMNGDRVGEDPYGNIYYQARKQNGGRRKRWVVYSAGLDEASRVPPDYHAWLHYTTDVFPSKDTPKRYEWLREHQPNMTGTPQAYRPPGHTLQGGKRDKATGDYEAWTPD